MIINSDDTDFFVDTLDHSPIVVNDSSLCQEQKKGDHDRFENPYRIAFVGTSLLEQL